MDNITLSYTQEDGVEVTYMITNPMCTITELLQHYANFTRAMGYPVDFGDEFQHVKFSEILGTTKRIPEEDEVGDGIND